MRRGAVISRYFLIELSNTTTLIDVRFLETPRLLTKDKIAPGGTPRLRRARRVYSRGSSHARTIFFDTSSLIFRFDVIVPSMLRRPYSLCSGLGSPIPSFSNSQS